MKTFNFAKCQMNFHIRKLKIKARCERKFSLKYIKKNARQLTREDENEKFYLI